MVPLWRRLRRQAVELPHLSIKPPRNRYGAIIGGRDKVVPTLGPAVLGMMRYLAMACAGRYQPSPPLSCLFNALPYGTVAEGTDPRDRYQCRRRSLIAIGGARGPRPAVRAVAMGLTARGEPGPQQGDRKAPRAIARKRCHGHRTIGGEREGPPTRPAPSIGSDQSQRCAPQYRSQRAARPLRTMAQETSPERGDVQKAAVRVPPAPPRETQRMAGPRTRIWPVRFRPCGVPSRPTR